MEDELQTPFGAKVLRIINGAFGGTHHVGKLHWSRYAAKSGGVCEFVPDCGSLSTWDADHLTRLVILCHDLSVRASLSPGGPRRIKITLSERESHGGEGGFGDYPISRGHPTILRAILAARKGLSVSALARKMMEKKS